MIPDGLTRLEKTLNKWTGERRRRHQERYMDRRETDPDEDTIYNVLCPQIRESWSIREEFQRRAMRPLPFVLPEVEHPKANGQDVYPKA